MKKSSPVKKTSLRSSRSQMFFKIGTLEKIVNYTGKQQLDSLLNNVGGLKAFISQKQSWRCFVKKVFLKILQYSQENCVGVFF